MPPSSHPPQTPLLVVAAVIQQNGRTLLTLRPQHKPQGGFWEFPGGKLQAGESPEQALQRELLEELAIEIHVEGIINNLYHEYDWGPVLILAYQCRILSGTPKNLEVAAHRWIATDELHKYRVLPADLPLIEQLQATQAREPERCD